MTDDTAKNIKGHVVYLVLINSHPCAWAGTRVDAERLAKGMRLREYERNEKAIKAGVYHPMQYTVCGITDSPYGDPEADTVERVESAYLKVTNGLSKTIGKIHNGYPTVGAIVKDLEALLC